MLILLLLLTLLSACGQGAVIDESPTSELTSGIVANSTPTFTLFVPTESPTLTTTPNPTETATLTLTPTLTATPDPLAGLTIEGLSGRTYGGGQIRIEETLADNSYFTRMFFSYTSDGLRIYGFMNVPKREDSPYPVVIALHGYIEPAIYNTLDYTTRYADALARAGYLVLHPNLRGYPPSDAGDNLFRVGMAVDVLNLVAIVQETGSKEGPLQQADPEAIGLWGHSMGGGISTRVMAVSPDVRAVLLYGAMSGDDRQNFERIFDYFSNGQRGQEELSYPPEAFERISPIYFLERVKAAVSVHHGENDGDVPLAWSLDLCQRLEDLEVNVECFTYPGQPHTFQGEGDQAFIQRMIEFYDRELKE